MSGLKLFTSNRMEILVEHLADTLKEPLSSPFASEIILVQSKGMEHWLSMELAKRHGICANIRFPYPIHFVHELFRETLPQIPEHSPYEPTNTTWDLMHILPALLDKPGFQHLKSYLSESEYDLKLFQLCERLAGLFDQYLLFRPDMILMWDRGLDDHWQATIWRDMVKIKGKIHRATLSHSFLKTIRQKKITFRKIHGRISLFGISALPPLHIQILHALSSVIDVHLFLMNPCREFWEDIVSDLEMSKLVTGRKKEDILPKDLHLETGNRLLASMGSLGRDFFHMINEIVFAEVTQYEDPGEASLLAAIQSDILNLRNREVSTDSLRRKHDDSITIHSCHSPLREVEVLHDYLLGLFEKYLHIQPDDILVMTPDINLYAPLINAVFHRPAEDHHWIPFSIADRVLVNESGIANTMIKLLDLAQSRFEVSRVLDILESEAVRLRFSLGEDDLPILHRWIRQTGIRWGINEEHRKKLGLPPLPWNTWRFGINRMLLGYAMPAARENPLFMDILPYNDIEGENAEKLGCFMKYMDILFSFMNILESKKNLDQWRDCLFSLLDAFFSPDEQHQKDIKAIRELIDELLPPQGFHRFDGTVSLDIIKYLLKKNLQEKGFGTGFLTGGVTFCTLLPMRSIPFKVICLLGMNDDAYPRHSRPPHFDLMSQSPRIGDRSRRMDDRYLFLEAFLSARQHFFISYVGQDIKDNSIRPPSVLVSELLDYIEEGFGTDTLKDITTIHRLQAFNPHYFSGSERSFSFSEDYFHAAQCALSPRRDPLPFISADLPEPDDEWKRIDLESLCSFFTNPARFLLNRRLAIYLNEDSPVLEEDEPFEIDTLARYFIKKDIVTKILEGEPLRDGYQLLQASGTLPHGSPGILAYDDLCKSTENLIKKIRPHIQEEPLPPREIDLSINGFRLTGRLSNLYPIGLISYRTAKMRGRDRLISWLYHLLLNDLDDLQINRSSLLICEDTSVKYKPVADAQVHLHILLNIYWRGLKKPLHFFTESSMVYAEKIVAGKEPTDAMKAAYAKWDGYTFSEKDNPYYKLCFRHIDPLDDEFRKLSLSIFEPMIRFEEEIK